MGAFYVTCAIENHVARNRTVEVRCLVDTGSEYTWIAAELLRRIDVKPEKKRMTFVMADGRTMSRRVGFAVIRYDRYFTIDEVVFARKGDLMFLGARSLEGLNLSVDARRKKLVAGGPMPVA